MRRRVLSIALLIALALPVFAGDVQVPGAPAPPPPPPCTENCGDNATSSPDSASLMEQIFGSLLLLILTP